MFPLLKSKLVNLRFIEGNGGERAFIRELFETEDVRKYYVLSKEQLADLDLFVTGLALCNVKHVGRNFIVELKDGTRVGLITAEVNNEKSILLKWNVGYAIVPAYRRRGYAYDALTFLMGLLQKTDIRYLMLDISEDNWASEGLAVKCGFEKMSSPDGRVFVFNDPYREELGIRYRWIKNPDYMSMRDEMNQNGIRHHMANNYLQAITLFKLSLDEPYEEGDFFDDGKIYANMGMSYFAAGMYYDAYDYLKKARNLGVRYATADNELAFLKGNMGFG